VVFGIVKVACFEVCFCPFAILDKSMIEIGHLGPALLFYLFGERMMGVGQR